MTLDSLILNIDNEVKKLNVPYIYCGSVSLYLNGMTEYITDFEDVDIDFFDMPELDLIMLPIGFVSGKPVDKLIKINDMERRFHKITFYDRELLITDIDYELETKQLFIQDETYRYRDKALQRIEQIKEFINKMD